MESPEAKKANKAPLIPLTAYQRRWVEDRARFKIGRVTRQGGKTFAATLEAVLDCYERVTKWVCLSRGERQSKELISQAKVHAKAIGVAVEEIEGSFRTDDAEYKMLEIVSPNGSRIIGLPANPDTARGWSANILLDEFALHKDSRAIWRALYPTITRGYKIRVISTPYGKKNKFYELCTADNGYSKHVVPIQVAVKEGLELRDEEGKITTVEELKKGFGDDEGWAQEYEVEFLDEATAFLTYDLIASVESEEAEEVPGWALSLSQMAKEAYKIYIRTKTDPPWGQLKGVEGLSGTEGDLYLGMDIGRRRDLTVIWLDESKDGISWTRAAIELVKQPFFVQKMVLFSLLNHPKMRRACIDQTGLGMQMAEEAIEKFGEGKVEGIDFTVANKEAMATELKKNFEDLQSRIPISNKIRNSLHSVKKYETSTGHFRFDADRTEETGHCYDDETEVLTDRGWKKFSEICFSDRLASLKSGDLVFDYPLAIQNYYYQGDMIRIQNKQIDLLVTPNHRLYIRMPGQKEFDFVEAFSIKDDPGRIEFKKDARWIGKDLVFDIAGQKLASEIWVEFMGYFLSQGFSSTEHRIGIYANEIETSPISRCLQKLPWTFWLEGKKRVKSYRLKNVQLWAELAKQGRQPDRYIPREILNLPVDKLKVFFEALMFGNGSSGESWCYRTTSYRLASDVQELLLKMGMAGSIVVWQPSIRGKNKRTIYRVNINRYRLAPQVNKRRKSISLEKYDGQIYCCSVPTGVIFVRRNGICLWCGNSDHFWAKALSAQAAGKPSLKIEYKGTGVKREFTRMEAYI